MYKLIVADDKTWYCKNCKVAHGGLYLVDKNIAYCNRCVPKDVRKLSTKVNQNGEIL